MSNKSESFEDFNFNDVSSIVYIRSLEDDCKKWFNRCDELSTYSGRVERELNQVKQKLKTAEEEIKILREAVDVAVRQMEAGRYLPSVRKPLKQALEKIENMEEKND